MTKTFNNIAYLMIGIASAQLLGLLSALYPAMTAGCWMLLFLIIVGLLIKTYLGGVKAHYRMNGYAGVSKLAMIPGLIVTIIYVILFLYGITLIF